MQTEVWTQPDLNRRPPLCKSGALNPLSYGPLRARGPHGPAASSIFEFATRIQAYILF